MFDVNKKKYNFKKINLIQYAFYFLSDKWQEGKTCEKFNKNCYIVILFSEEPALLPQFRINIDFI